MNLILISTLYPSSAEPTRATYNRSLMTALARQGHDVTVIAPVMWCPLVDSLLRRRRCPPGEEVLDGISVLHPRVFYTPGMWIDRHYLSYRRTVRRQLLSRLSAPSAAPREEKHVMLGFVYPDGVAMAPVCREFGVPYSVAVLGSDFRMRTKQPQFREMVMQCLHEAPLVFCPGRH